MVYFPILSVAPEYFDRHRGAAMGFILSGASIGGLVLSPLVRTFLGVIGVRWTLRAMALANMVITLPVAISAPPSRSMARRPTLVNIRLAKKPAFILQSLAALLQASGNFVPMTFLPEFSTVVGYSVSFGATLLAVNNGINAVSRVLMGVTADKLGRQNTLVLGVAGSAASVWCLWLAAAVNGGKAAWLTFVVVYGILAGSYNTAVNPPSTPPNWHICSRIDANSSMIGGKSRSNPLFQRPNYDILTKERLTLTWGCVTLNPSDT